MESLPAIVGAQHPSSSDPRIAPGYLQKPRFNHDHYRRLYSFIVSVSARESELRRRKTMTFYAIVKLSPPKKNVSLIEPCEKANLRDAVCVVYHRAAFIARP